MGGKHRRLKWRILKMLGCERLVWNIEWAAGRWNYLDAVETTSIDIVRKYSRNGCILELGCGSGALAARIGNQFYTRYKGIDISDVAIKRARLRRLEKAEFEVGSMELAEFPSADLIIIREALYYLEPHQQTKLLEKCVNAVGAHGAIYIRVGDATQFTDVIERVFKAGSVIEELRVKRNSKNAVHVVIGSNEAMTE